MLLLSLQLMVSGSRGVAPSRYKPFVVPNVSSAATFAGFATQSSARERALSASAPACICNWMLTARRDWVFETVMAAMPSIARMSSTTSAITSDAPRSRVPPYKDVFMCVSLVAQMDDGCEYVERNPVVRNLHHFGPQRELALVLKLDLL